MKTRIAISSAFYCLVIATHAQVFLDGSPYLQDFDTLANSGTANPWTENATLPGWYAAAVNGFGTYRGNNGSATSGDLYSFG